MKSSFHGQSLREYSTDLALHIHNSRWTVSPKKDENICSRAAEISSFLSCVFGCVFCICSMFLFCVCLRFSHFAFFLGKCCTCVVNLMKLFSSFACFSGLFACVFLNCFVLSFQGHRTPASSSNYTGGEQAELTVFPLTVV